MSDIKLIECPRDAMQGLHDFIETDTKARYINQLLKVGFDTIDFGSFVSPKAIPQMRDTAEVLTKLDLGSTSSKLLAIVANQRGADDACQFDEIDYLGFPFSISETFQQRNTKSSIEESLSRVDSIQKLAIKSKKKLVVYISMAFGNPYEDEWNAEIAIRWSKKLSDMGVEILALSDTIGAANPNDIEYLFKSLIPELPSVEFGAHLHSTPQTVDSKLAAAINAGCKRIDGAIKGYGGCPMAKNDLTGNMPTEIMKSYLEGNRLNLGLNDNAFAESLAMVNGVFPQ
jgi:hydroxymethylglutaryl-CoA lyase